MKSYVLCCVSVKPFTQDFIQELNSFLIKSNAKIIKTEKLFEQDLFAQNIYLDIPCNSEELKLELINISDRFQIDIALIPIEHFRAEWKLIVFDMDSTLIQHEVIDQMALLHGVGDKVKAITERAMNGDINFDEALKERVSLLKGLKKEQMEKILEGLKLSSGVETLIKEVQRCGHKTAIISGGFKYFAEVFQARLKMDYAFANDLEWENNILNGEIKGKIINAQEKAHLLEELAKIENIRIDQIVAVGDGANDLLMLNKAGLGVAFHAKERVRREASHRLSYGPMTTLLYFLGIPGNNLDEIN